MDLNNDGIINNGGKLFGNQTILQNDQRTTNGFQVLADLDGNADGKIDANNIAFSQIKVWQDMDGNVYPSTDELKTLVEMGISALNTAHTIKNTPDGHGKHPNKGGVLVESFIAATDVSVCSLLMEQILCKWTRTENVSPSIS